MWKYKRFQLPLVSRLIFIACIILLIIGAISLSIIEDDGDRSRIIFQMFETAVMMFVLFLPYMLNKSLPAKIPTYMEIFFVFFCFCSLILGDVNNFYGRFAWWDTMLHGISGLMLGIVAYGLILPFTKIGQGEPQLSRLAVSIWILCFSVAIGALWEILEFTVDGLFGLNSQEFLESSGTFDQVAVPRIGREALKDTMIDLILNFAGALVTAILAWFDLRRKEPRK